MRSRLWDYVESYLAELVLVQSISVRKAVPDACDHFRDLPTPYLILALVSIAAVLDNEDESEILKPFERALELYRAVAVISSELATLEALGKPLTTCGELLAHWQNTDDKYFDFSSI
ncbi:MAG: hypothetical protein AAFY56_18160 [Pseudomonadota bacterium]